MVLGNRIDPYDPAVISSAMGAEFGLCLVRTEVHRMAHWAMGHDVKVIGSSPKASVAWDEFRYPARMVLRLGDERQGMSETAMEGCAQSVRIPIFGRADSLNVATAAGILIYEVVRQRRDHWHTLGIGADTG
jgi:TrmH family RNA methyltransferase